MSEPTIDEAAAAAATPPAEEPAATLTDHLESAIDAADLVPTELTDATPADTAAALREAGVVEGDTITASDGPGTEETTGAVSFPPEGGAEIETTDPAPEPAAPAREEVRIRAVEIVVPMVPTVGYIATSFGLSLSGEQGQVLADLTAGLSAAGYQLGQGGAIGWLLDAIRDEGKVMERVHR